MDYRTEAQKDRNARGMVLFAGQEITREAYDRIRGITPSTVDGKGEDMPTITKSRGPAGQISYTAATDDGPLTFVGSVYGGPIVMVLPSGAQTFVSDPGRFASGHSFGNILDEGWVRNFLSA